RSVAGDRAVIDLPADLLGDRCGNLLGAVAVKVHAAAGAVALEPVADVEVLLEVMLQREIEKRPAARGQLHRGGQPTLDDREVARHKVAVEIVHVRPDLEPVRVAGSIRGPATTIIRSSGTSRFVSGKLAITRRSRSAPTPEPPTVTLHTRSSDA